MQNNVLEKWVERIFEFHRNPVKVEFLETKNYLKLDEEKERRDVEQGLTALYKTLERERVERRCARLEGLWDETSKLVKMTRLGGFSLKNFGFQDKTGRYLDPEEAMYLLESNRLEILWNNVTMSVEQAYSNLLAPPLSIDKYATYRKLVSDGFKVLVRSRKRTCKPEDASSSPIKRIRYERDEKISEIGHSKESECNKCSDSISSRSDVDPYQKIFLKLKETGPKRWTKRLDQSPHYKAFPITKSNENRSFNVFICDNEKLNPKWGLLEEDSANLFGFLQNDGVAFYRFSSVNVSEPQYIK